MVGQGRDYAAMWIATALAVAGTAVGIAASSEPWWATSVIALASAIVSLLLLIVYGRRVLVTIDRWEQKINARFQSPTKKRNTKEPAKSRLLVTASLLAGLAVGIGWIGGMYLSPETPSTSKTLTVGSNTSPVTPAACPRGRPLLFAISGRMYSPSPVLTETMQTAIVNAIQANSPIGFLNVDGQPHMLRWMDFSNHHNEFTKAADLDSIKSYVSSIRATSPHVDILNSLAIAGDAIHSLCNEGTLFLEDSGLQDIKPLNFTDSSLFTAYPTDVVKFLRGEKEVPNLRGIGVTLVGIGYTAPPQAPLDIQQRASLVDIWSAIAQASRAATVNVDPSPPTGAAPANVPSVQVVQIPTPHQYYLTPRHVPVVLLDDGPAGFFPDSTKFRDPSEAATALKGIAKYLEAHPATMIRLTGTSADNGSLSAAIVLSHARAEAVQSLLVKLGAPPNQIITTGVGWHFPGYLNDHGPNGLLLPGPAEHNRSVIVSFVQ